MEREETAALAALGFLTPREAAAAHPREVRAMENAAALLAGNVRPVTPSPDLKSRLLSRVSAWETLKPMADVRPHDGGWTSTGLPGVDMRKLFRDPQTGRTTLLLRMEPGVSFPAHHHGDDEQCLVLKGDIRFGDLVYEEGDFVVMGKSTTHPEIHTVGGNLLLLVAGHNEFVQP